VNTELKAIHLWEALGWLLLMAVVVLSLVQIDQPIEISGVDKFEHVLAYGVLMYWWGMVQPGRLLRWVMFLPVLGFGLELAQLRMPGRFMEWRDVLANLAGVVLAFMLLRTRARDLLAWTDRKLFDRTDPRLP
jgi:VanZ family protein